MIIGLNKVILPALNNNSHPPRFHHLHHRIRNLPRQPLLNLQSSCKHVRDPGEFGKADDAAVGEIADGGAAVEGDEVVFAQRMDLRRGIGGE